MRVVFFFFVTSEVSAGEYLQHVAEVSLRFEDPRSVFKGSSQRVSGVLSACFQWGQQCFRWSEFWGWSRGSYSVSGVVATGFLGCMRHFLVITSDVWEGNWVRRNHQVFWGEFLLQILNFFERENLFKKGTDCLRSLRRE